MYLTLHSFSQKLCSALIELNIVGVYQDPRRSSTTSSANSGNYEASVVVLYCQLYLTQRQIQTNKLDGVITITSF